MEEQISQMPEFKQTNQIIQHCTCILYNIELHIQHTVNICMINGSHMFTYLIYPGVSLATFNVLYIT